jgi:hypothetical protein
MYEPAFSEGMRGSVSIVENCDTSGSNMRIGSCMSTFSLLLRGTLVSTTPELMVVAAI